MRAAQQLFGATITKAAFIIMRCQSICNDEHIGRLTYYRVSVLRYLNPKTIRAKELRYD